MVDETKIDLTDRDPNGINSHIRICFEETFGEPDGVRSIDVVWLNSYKCLQCGKLVCYRLLTTFCGLCLALGWGCHVAVVGFLHVWCCTPGLRQFAIGLGCVQRVYGTILDCWCTPAFEAVGMLFSRIVLTMKKSPVEVRLIGE